MKRNESILAQIKDIYQDLNAINIHQMHQAQPMSLIEHVHQTKINLFESLRAWLDEEIVADTWIDAYQVMRDDEHLNKDLDYLITSLTYDNETTQLSETLAQDLYGKTINAKRIEIRRISTMSI